MIIKYQFYYYKMKLFLFDVDGTICESGKKITSHMSNLINKLDGDIGLVGGGCFTKITDQIGNNIKPLYIFSENSTVYHKLDSCFNYINVHKFNIRSEPEYGRINDLIKLALLYIANQKYVISGQIIDVRNGLIYVSLVGMQATDDERNNFIKEDGIYGYRLELLNLLKNKVANLNLLDSVDIKLGGSVGIALTLSKWNKINVLNYIPHYDEIHYFGDRYTDDGNDFQLLNSNLVIPHPVDTLNDTCCVLENLL